MASQSKSISRKRDLAWEHCTHLMETNLLECSYCKKLFHPSKILRVKEHLAYKCSEASTEVRNSMLESLISSKKIRIEERNSPVQESINLERFSSYTVGKFFLTSGMSFDAINSKEFRDMIDVVAKKGSSVRPSISDIRGWILDRSVDEMREDLQQREDDWVKNGCSVIADEWQSNGKIYLTFSVRCLDKLTFLKTCDVTDIIPGFSSTLLSDLFKETIKQIGPQNVVAILTKYKEPYIEVGGKLVDEFPNIYWVPCGNDWVDEILKEFSEIEWIHELIEEARCFSKYIYNNPLVLNTMRKSTGGLDMVVVGPTSSSTDFLTIKQMVSLRKQLQTMVLGEDWKSLCYLEEKGKQVSECIRRESFWVQCEIVTHLTSPLLRLLNIVNNIKKPDIGFVFACMYKAKETIKEKFVGEEELYWGIIERKWKLLPQLPLYAAGFYLNSRFFYGCSVGIQNRLRSAFFRCLEKLVSDKTVLEETCKETIKYHEAQGEFGQPVAQSGRRDDPGKWWSIFGWECPNLTQSATRILNHTSSLTGYRPNRESFQHVIEAKNEVEQQLLIHILNVQSHSGIKHVFDTNEEDENQDPISHDLVGTVEAWIRGETMSCEESEWKPIDQPKFKVDQEDLSEVLGEVFCDDDIFGSLFVNQ